MYVKVSTVRSGKKTYRYLTLAESFRNEDGPPRSRIVAAVSPQHSGAMPTGTVMSNTSATTLFRIKLSSAKGWWTISAKETLVVVK